MKFETSFLLRPESQADGHSPAWHHLSPARVGLAAALRRAFDVPANEDDPGFEELLRKIG